METNLVGNLESQEVVFIANNYMEMEMQDTQDCGTENQFLLPEGRKEGDNDST